MIKEANIVIDYIHGYYSNLLIQDNNYLIELSYKAGNIIHGDLSYIYITIKCGEQIHYYYWYYADNEWLTTDNGKIKNVCVGDIISIIKETTYNNIIHMSKIFIVMTNGV